MPDDAPVTTATLPCHTARPSDTRPLPGCCCCCCAAEPAAAPAAAGCDDACCPPPGWLLPVLSPPSTSRAGCCCCCWGPPSASAPPPAPPLLLLGVDEMKPEPTLGSALAAATPAAAAAAAFELLLAWAPLLACSAPAAAVLLLAPPLPSAAAASSSSSSNLTSSGTWPGSAGRPASACCIDGQQSRSGEGRGAAVSAAGVSSRDGGARAPLTPPHPRQGSNQCIITGSHLCDASQLCCCPVQVLIEQEVIKQTCLIQAGQCGAPGAGVCALSACGKVCKDGAPGVLMPSITAALVALVARQTPTHPAPTW